ncbi:MAG: di-heme oxidoredictase family protein [Flavobacteriales bacterium]|jgi:CxxC motif-containing protein (DUF1111 family)
MSKSGFVSILIGAIVVGFASSCEKEKQKPNAPVEETPINIEYYSGGTTTSFNSGIGAYRQPLANLQGADLIRHFNGDALFHQAFAPLGTSAFSGLGPLFIENSCGACHVEGGRGGLATISDIGLLLRVSAQGSGPNGAPLDLPGFGTQLQSKSIDGTVPEGQMHIEWEYIPVNFPDGHLVILKQPYFSISEPYNQLPPFYLRGARHAPPVYGIGLLDAVSDETILSLADENDLDGDIISGRPNYVWNKQTQSLTIGRFGWKSNNPNALQQAADAFHQDMGITTENFFTTENCIGQSNCEVGIQKSPDIGSNILNDITYYFLTLAPPAPRNLEDPQVMRGKEIFNQIKCSACHVPELITGYHEIPELRNQTIRPYTDLLLHELGAGLGDGRPDFEAGANEWRTPPLWGIGLTKTIFPNAGFLHDGRAATLEEAILWHEGEANESKMAFMNLTTDERAALIAFLNAL